MNFEQMARAILCGDDHDQLRDLLEGMRQVWNARGAADIAKLEAEPWTSHGPHPPDTDRFVTTSGYDGYEAKVSVKNLVDALRKLDC